MFKHPFTAIVGGPTQCGKTHFISTLLKNRNKMIDPPPENCFLIYDTFQPIYATMMPINLIKGLPNDFNTILEKDCSRKLIIIDDQMREAYESSNILDLFSKASHHRNCSVILLSQNIFHKSRHQRDISLNSHYLILFKSPRDIQQIGILGSQMGCRNYFMDSFRLATKRPFGYLCVNLRSNCEDEQTRLVSGIFGELGHPIAYLPK